MALSGSTNFILTAEELILKAYKKLGVVAKGQSVDADQSQAGLDALNLMLATWNMNGYLSWKRKTGILFLDAGTSSYTIGPSGSHSTLSSDFVGTKLNGGEPVGESNLAVDSTAGMAVSDNIGVALDDGTRQWGTISAIPSSSIVTVSSGLNVAAGDDNTVFTYTNKLSRPSRLCRDTVTLQTFDQTTRKPISSISLSDYNQLHDIATQGVITQYAYSGTRTNGTIQFWQNPNSINDYVNFLFDETLEDVDSSTDDVDVPKEWLETVVYNLAVRLADEFPSVSDRKIATITSRAANLLAGSLADTSEDDDLYLTVTD